MINMRRAIHIFRVGNICILQLTPFPGTFDRYHLLPFEELFVCWLAFELYLWGVQKRLAILFMRRLNLVLFILFLIAWWSIEWNLWLLIWDIQIVWYFNGRWGHIMLLISSWIIEFSWRTEPVIWNLLSAINIWIILRIIVCFESKGLILLRICTGAVKWDVWS